MFDWWHERKREKILETPFPEPWRRVLARNVAHYARLDEDERKRLHELTQVFIAEKQWEGCGGLELSEEMQVTIAAQACLLVLELPHRMYRNVDSILVYPSAVLRPARQQGVFVRSPDLVASGPVALLGEAHHGGPVVLAWDRVLRDGQRPSDGHNLVYHEFAHKLDMLDGNADGTPPLHDRAALSRWAAACEAAFIELREKSAVGSATVLDSYGATNEAEFFAVATDLPDLRPRIGTSCVHLRQDHKLAAQLRRARLGARAHRTRAEQQSCPRERRGCAS
jgi:Mlc titration factor MtfA (ptsG expression regulator)